jgi:hypothetical protein
MATPTDCGLRTYCGLGLRTTADRSTETNHLDLLLRKLHGANILAYTGEMHA